MTDIKPGDLFTITHKEGSHLHKIGDRSYIGDIFICEAAEQINPERFIVTGKCLRRESGNILRLPKAGTLGDYLSKFSDHEDNIYKYEGVYKLVEETEEEPTTNNNSSCV